MLAFAEQADAMVVTDETSVHGPVGADPTWIFNSQEFVLVLRFLEKVRDSGFTISGVTANSPGALKRIPVPVQAWFAATVAPVSTQSP